MNIWCIIHLLVDWFVSRRWPEDGVTSEKKKKCEWFQAQQLLLAKSHQKRFPTKWQMVPGSAWHMLRLMPISNNILATLLLFHKCCKLKVLLQSMRTWGANCANSSPGGSKEFLHLGATWVQIYWLFNVCLTIQINQTLWPSSGIAEVRERFLKNNERMQVLSLAKYNRTLHILSWDAFSHILLVSQTRAPNLSQLVNKMWVVRKGHVHLRQLKLSWEVTHKAKHSLLSYRVLLISRW